MIEVDRTIDSVVREKFQNLQDKLVNEEELRVVASHLGSFSQDLIAGLASNIEELLLSIGDNKIVVRRVFSIMIEGLQYFKGYGERDERGKQIGFFIVSTSDENHKIIFSKLLNSKKINELEEYLSTTQGLSPEELDEKYQLSLSDQFLSDSNKRTGLGILSVCVKSGHQLKWFSDKINDDLKLFTAEVVLSRQVD